MIRAGACSPASTHDDGGQELHQGAQQGRAEGDVQDGHLDAAELLAARRSSRPSASSQAFVDQLLHLHGRRASAASAIDVIAEEVRRRHDAPYPGAGRCTAAATSSRAASTSGAATASTTCSTRTRCSSCSTRPAAASYERLQGVQRRRGRPEPSTARRCAACSTSRPAAPSVPIDEVEPATTIVKRFATGAMSLRLDLAPRRTRRWPSP